VEIRRDEYSPAEIELIGERDSMGGLPPPFSEKWVIYVDIEGFSQIMSDPKRGSRLAHTYWDLAGSLQWGGRQHRVLNAAMTAAGEERPMIQQTMLEKLQLWKTRLRVFSDSVFVFLDPSGLSGRSPSDATLDGNLVPDVASWLSRRLWESGFPHKGGISYGSCLCDAERNVFVGDAITRAVRWAEMQGWFGISIDPSADAYAKRDLTNAPFLVSAQVPIAETRGSRPILQAATAISCFPSDERKEGARIGQDLTLDGFLRAIHESPQDRQSVQDRYRSTARLWREYFGAGAGASREAELKSIAGE
jgi:hypothetical protein